MITVNAVLYHTVESTKMIPENVLPPFSTLLRGESGKGEFA